MESSTTDGGAWLVAKNHEPVAQDVWWQGEPPAAKETGLSARKQLSSFHLVPEPQPLFTDPPPLLLAVAGKPEHGKAPSNHGTVQEPEPLARV